MSAIESSRPTSDGDGHSENAPGSLSDGLPIGPVRHGKGGGSRGDRP